MASTAQIDSYMSTSRVKAFRTQKAKGLAALCSFGFTIPYPTSIFRSEEEIHKEFVKFPTFARPCPVRPRHGFVESRQVKSLEELLALWKETEQEDPQCELITLPFIKAKYNYVITPSLLAVGPGHDGATAGKKSISIPITKLKVDQHENLYDLAGITETPFFEAVSGDEDGFMFTQLRNGPSLPATVDYIPFDCVVGRVVKVDSDMSLLEWEELVKTMRDGDVVYHENGNLASHFAVHCVTAKVPYITSFKPSEGDFVVASGADPYDAEEMKIGVSLAFAQQVDVHDLHGVTTAAFSFLHNAAMLTGKFSRLIGYSAGLLHRLGTTALLGELRHARGNRRRQGRNTIYRWALQNAWSARRKLYRAAKGFATYGWSSGYGGPAWANVAQSTFNLDTAIKDLFKDQKGAVEDTIGALNVLVNTMHNGGKSLNKFISETQMDLCAVNNVLVMGTFGRHAYEILNSEADKFWMEQWAKARQLRIKLEFVKKHHTEIVYAKKDAGTSYVTILCFSREPSEEEFKAAREGASPSYRSSLHYDTIAGEHFNGWAKLEKVYTANNVEFRTTTGEKLYSEAVVLKVEWRGR